MELIKSSVLIQDLSNRVAPIPPRSDMNDRDGPNNLATRNDMDYVRQSRESIVRKTAFHQFQLGLLIIASLSYNLPP